MQVTHERHHGLPECVPDAHSKQDSEQRDLSADQHRPHRDTPRRDAHHHCDADLATLRFDHPRREVEGGDDGARQDEHGEDVVGLLVTIDVFVVDLECGIVVLHGHSRAHAG